jgi:hypothetical protein
MAESKAFQYVCEDLENRTSLDRLAARGTVRLALKEAGLDPASVTPIQMAVVLRQVMPRELQSRGIADAEKVCDAIRTGVQTLPAEASADSPDAVFARLGGQR